MVSRLEYDYSMNQSPPGDYFYVKVWDSGPILRADLRQKDESGNTLLVSKFATPVFPDFPIFLVPQLAPLLGLGGLTIFCQSGTKNIGYAWISCFYGLVTQLFQNICYYLTVDF